MLRILDRSTGSAPYQVESEWHTRAALNSRCSRSIIPFLCGWKDLVRCRICLSLSELMSFVVIIMRQSKGTIQPRRKVSATVTTVIDSKGNTSGHCVNLTMTVRQYRTDHDEMNVLKACWWCREIHLGTASMAPDARQSRRSSGRY